MSILQPPILSTSVVKTESPTIIKNEPPEPEIMNIDIDEDIKNIDIVSHPLSEDLIKSETVPENIFESKHSEYVEAQAFVKAENVSLVQIENIIECEKTEDTDDGNGTWNTGQEAVEVQGIHTKHPKKTDRVRCHKTLESNLWKKEKEKIKVIKAPVIQHSCDQCDFTTYRPSRLNVHKLIHLKPEESQYFYCDHCSFKSRHKNKLEKHSFRLHKKNVESKQKRFSCDRCDYKTYFRANLEKHNIIHLKPEESQYFYCDHCSFKSRHKRSVKQHIFRLHNKNAESKQKRFSCDRCDFRTRYYDSLKNHKIIHLKPEESQYFYCDHCPLKSRHEKYVKKHIFRFHNKNVESKQKRFSCDRCDFKTRYSANLKNHNLIHLKPEESQYFYCYHCSFKSKRKSSVQTHIFGLHNKNVESKQKRFSCDRCDFKTRYHVSLKNHNLIHLKPEDTQYFYCSHCSFKTKYKNSLSSHQASRRHCKNVEIEQKQISSEIIEIGVDDILDSSDILDEKDIDIVYNSLCENSIKIETVPENTFERKHWESVETQVSIQTENTPFIKTENISQNETLIMSKDISDGNENRDTGQGAIEIQGSIDQFNSVETNKQFLNQSKGISARSRKAKHSKTTPSWRKAPLILHSCDQCDFTTYSPSRLNVHKLIHLKPEESEYFYCCHCVFKSRYIDSVKTHMLERHYKIVAIKQKRFRCDHCDYQTQRRHHLKRHNLIHLKLKPEESQYFYCYHCSFKSKHKSSLRGHILRHFQNEEVKFCCYICDFMTLERELIIYHIRKHSKVRNKSKINEGN